MSASPPLTVSGLDDMTRIELDADVACPDWAGGTAAPLFIAMVCGELPLSPPHAASETTSADTDKRPANAMSLVVGSILFA
jgi:hypothetical protein